MLTISLKRSQRRLAWSTILLVLVVIQLPVGSYGLDVTQPGREDTDDLEVVRDGDEEVGLVARFPNGLVTKAESDKVAKAGNGLRHGLWTSFGVHDGMPSAQVIDLLQDAKGNIWIAFNESGLSRYDGTSFTSFTVDDGLTDDRVHAILEDRQGNIWVGTNGGGISRYDGTQFTNFTIDDGLVGDDVHAIAEDRNGGLWFGSHAGVSRYDGHQFTNFTREAGLEGVHAIREDRDGNLWFGTYGGGVSRFDGRAFTTFDNSDGLAHGVVWSILEDRNGALWFATWGGGVSRYDDRGFSTFTTEDGLADNQVGAVLEDREGYLWFGGIGGISRYDGSQLKTFTTEDGLAHNRAWSILQDSAGRVWIGTLEGLSRYDGNEFTTFTTDDGLGHNWVYDIIEDKVGNLWIGTNGGGISRYDGHRFTTFTTDDGLSNNQVRTLFEDAEGYLWIGGRGGGVSRYDGTEFTNLTIEDGLPMEMVHAITQDRNGNMWFGTLGGGVSRYDGKEITTLGTTDGIAHEQVLSILEDRDGTMWFGTLDGLNRYDGQELTTFTAKDGLAENWVWSILEDQSGLLWFGTRGGGVSRFDGLVFQSLSRNDGLANNTVRDLYQDRDGYTWAATEAGVVRYRPPVTAPSIRVTDVVADRRYSKVQTLSLPSSQQLVSFEFQGSSLTTPSNRIAYVYRLQGFEDEWHLTHEERVEYSDLPVGDYSFEVKAVDRDLNYSETSATVALNVYPSYERVGWISALSLAAVLIVGLGARLGLQDRKLRISNKELVESNEDLGRARDDAEAANRAKSLFLANMSHEIRTPMNAILGYAQILRRNPDMPSDDQRAVENIQQGGDHLLNLINDVLDISKIEAGRMEVSTADFDLRILVETLGSMFELQCREKGLGWRLDGLAATRRTVHGDEDKLRQVLINLLSNSLKFTEEGEVALKVESTAEDEYRFEVIDTGPGFSTEDQESLLQPFQQGPAGRLQGGTGLGLAIAKRQLELMGGRLTVDSSARSGSCVAFTVPLPPAKETVRADAETPWMRVKRLAPGNTAKVLVADDVAENRDVLRRMLTDIGVEVTLAEDGQQALDSLDSLVDIVFLDIRMPVVNGLDVMKQMQEQGLTKEVKVVAISASVLEHERQEYLAAGFDDFLAKPVRFEQICACLAKHLEVEFEYAEPVEAEVATNNLVDWGLVELPADLHERLKETAEIYSVTQMENCLKKVEELGATQRALAAHLRTLKQQHDMDSILNVLAEVRHA